MLLQLHILAHAQHAVNLLYPEPMQNVGHQLLEPHILHSGNIFSSFEVLRCSIGATLSGVIYKVL